MKTAIIVGDTIFIENKSFDGTAFTSENIRRFPAQSEGWFLPLLLVKAGLFKSTSDVKRINEQRKHTIKGRGEAADLWRVVKEPEATRFKIGKQIIWLFVGE